MVPILVAGGIVCLTNDAGAKPKAKPSPTPAPTATPVPTPTPTPTPAPTASNQSTTATYNGDQQGRYIAAAKEAFIALRSAKSQPFIDAYMAFQAAGGLSAKGLNSREDIAARRDLLAKTAAANDDYLAFVRDEEDIYRVELDKTPLIQGDVDTLVKQFDERTNLQLSIKLRATQAEALKAGDETLDFLQKKIGTWTFTDSGSIKFKKPADLATMSALGKKYNAKSVELQEYQKELQAVVAGASPSPSPSPSNVPAATPTPTMTPTPSATATPSPTATATAAPSVKR